MKVLMVCLGNICRSPLAQGVLENKLEQKGIKWNVDSAGTSAWHINEAPDSRSIDIGKKNGIDISSQRARKFSAADFDEFDLILPMDSSNYYDIVRQARSEEDKYKVHLILNYAFPGENRAVPDPYYDNNFQKVYELLDIACDKFISEHLVVK
jgi:protein-tyrosine phosphatase